MDHVTGEADKSGLRVDFDRRLNLDPWRAQLRLVAERGSGLLRRRPHARDHGREND